MPTKQPSSRKPAAKKPAAARSRARKPTKSVDLEALRSEVSDMLAEQKASTPIAATSAFRVPAGSESAFLRHIDALAEVARDAAGNSVFSFHKRKGAGSSDTLEYLVYEDWQSVAQFQSHWQSDELASFHDKMTEALAEDPDMQFFYGSDDVGGVPVPKTGLTRCWDAEGNEIEPGGTGQDAEVDAGLEWPSPRFSDNGDGTVTDHLTNLIWLKNADRFGEVTWKEALDKSKFLAADGGQLDDGSEAGDWRLPNVRELRSLLDYSQVAPMIPPDHPFDSVQNAIYWTSTTLASAPTLAWMTTMGIGPAVFDLKVNRSRMWPVRGKGRVARTGQIQCWDSAGLLMESCAGSGQDGDIRAGVAPPTPRFVANGDGTVLDKLTGLIWLESANPFGWCTWQQALDLCNSLCHGQHGLSDDSGEGDWRLPNVLELESLIDYGRFAPSLPEDQPFKDVGPTSYWTSTTVSSAPTQAMFSILGVGPSIFEHKEHPFLVWPVRDAR